MYIVWSTGTNYNVLNWLLSYCLFNYHGSVYLTIISWLYKYLLCLKGNNRWNTHGTVLRPFQSDLHFSTMHQQQKQNHNTVEISIFYFYQFYLYFIHNIKHKWQTLQGKKSILLKYDILETFPLKVRTFQ